MVKINPDAGAGPAKKVTVIIEWEDGSPTTTITDEHVTDCSYSLEFGTFKYEDPKSPGVDFYAHDGNRIVTFWAKSFDASRIQKK